MIRSRDDERSFRDHVIGRRDYEKVLATTRLGEEVTEESFWDHLVKSRGNGRKFH
jgi:hypothetical protein